MRLEEVVGQQIRDAREAARMSQADLGRALAPLLGKPWSRQAVFAAEKGGRDFKVAELVAIARVLHTTVSQLVTPGPEVTGSRENRQAIMLPGGEVITSMELIDAVLPDKVDMDSASGRVAATGNHLAGHIVEARSHLLQAAEASAKSMDTLTGLLQQVQALTRTPAPQGEEPPE